jgi:glycosyltransferase involved in cell wall biosynthesis
MLDPWFKTHLPAQAFQETALWPWAEYRVLRDATAVLFTSEEERRLARESFALYRCREVVVNFGTAAPEVDFSAARKEFLDRFPELREKDLLLFLGRLHEKKGCEELLRAFATSASDSPRLHLVMAGPCADQDYLGHLKRLTNQLGASGRVTFSGLLSGNSKWGAFAAAEAFVLPSHQENFGIAVVEALACGKPVLLSKKINIWREIVDDRAGYVEEDDLAGAQRLFARWGETTPAQRRELSHQARRCFAEHFEINRAVDSLLDVVQHPPSDA